MLGLVVVNQLLSNIFKPYLFSAYCAGIVVIKSPIDKGILVSASSSSSLLKCTKVRPYQYKYCFYGIIEHNTNLYFTEELTQKSSALYTFEKLYSQAMQLQVQVSMTFCINTTINKQTFISFGDWKKFLGLNPQSCLENSQVADRGIPLDGGWGYLVIMQKA